MYPNSEMEESMSETTRVDGFVGVPGWGGVGWGGGREWVKELNLVNTMQFYLHITAVRIGAVPHQRINIEYKLINFTKQSENTKCSR